VGMPRRGQRNIQDKKTQHYRQMLNNTEHLCKSQVYNRLYDRLKTDGRLDRFIAVVQYCSMSGLDIKDSIEVIVKSFPSYIDEKDLTVECFTDMIKNYNDISVAWGYGSLGDEISQIIVKNKALRIVEKTDSMQDIMIYQEMFGKKNDISNEDKVTTVNLILGKKR
jgi:hypothetical protein